MQLYVYFDTEVDASTMEKSLDLDWHPGDEGDNDQQRRSVDPVVVESRQCINPFTTIHDGNFRRLSSCYVTIHDRNCRRIYYSYTRIPGS